MTRKNLLALVGSICLVLVLAAMPFLTACTPPEEVTPSPPEEGAPSPVVPEYSHRISFCCPTEHPMYRSAEIFKDLLQTRSNGRIKIDIYPNDELGTPQACLDMAYAGDLDWVWGAPLSYLTNFVPWASLGDYPFAFSDYVDAWLRYQSIVPEINKELAEYNLRIMGCSTSGFRVWFSHFPIEKPADIKGKKYRVQAAGIAPKYVECWGGKPMVTPWAEVFTSMESKVIDMFDLPIGSADDNHFYEIVPYVTVSNVVYTSYTNVMSLSSFNALPKDLQDLIVECIKPADAYMSLEGRLYSDTATYARWEKMGISVSYLNPEQMEAFKAPLGPVKEYALQEYSEDQVALFTEQ